ARQAEGIGIRSAFGFPVLVGKEVVAVLEFFSPETIDPDEQLLTAMSQIGTQIGRVIERKKAEAALRESEARLRRAEDFSLIMVTHVGLDGRWLKVPQTLCDLLGYTEEELLSGYFKDVTHPDDFEADWSQCQRLIRGEVKSFDLEKRYIRKDGEIIWIYLNCSIVTDADGKPVQFLTYIRDITQRKKAEEALRKAYDELEMRVQERTKELVKANEELQAEVIERMRVEEALRQSEQLYRAIGESINYGIWICDPEGKNIYASESFLKLVGITQEECSEFGWGNVLHPDDAEATIEAWKQCARTGSFWEREHRFKGVDGKWHYVLARGVPIRDDKGEITCWVGINLDIDEMKQIEQALKHSEEQFRIVTEVMPQLVWTGNSEGSIDFCNSRFLSYTGLPMSEIRGGGLPKAVHPEDRPSTFEAWHQSVKTGQEFQVEHRLRSADGEYRWFLTRALPLRDYTGQIVKWYGTSTDIQDRKRAEETLQRERELLQRIMDAIPVMITVYEPNTKVMRLNKEFGRLIGWSTEEARQVDLMEKCYPDPEYREMVREYMESLQEGWKDLKIATKDGDFVESSWSNIRLSDDTHIGIGIDVRESKQAEDRLRALYELSEAVGRAETMEQVYEAALDTSKHTLRADRASVLLFDQNRVMRFRAWHGLSDYYRSQAEGHSP
ncbi:MAG TPA: PAS domain S-box protein, partial [Thermodesulfobacteriota bacterium]|nr:PAS domain S-box protein [Thermodesulfobacteriota bacterium]